MPIHPDASAKNPMQRSGSMGRHDRLQFVPAMAGQPAVSGHVMDARALPVGGLFQLFAAGLDVLAHTSHGIAARQQHGSAQQGSGQIFDHEGSPAEE